MAPLKAKFNDTLSKLRDRFDRDHNRDRVNQFTTASGESNGPLATQPRALPDGSPSTSFPMIAPSCIGPVSHNFSVSTDVPLLSPPTGGLVSTFARHPFTPSTSPSQSSSMSVEYTSAPLSPKLEVEPRGLPKPMGSGRTKTDPIDLTAPDTPGLSHDPRKSQALPAGSRFNPIDLTQVAPYSLSTACQLASHHKSGSRYGPAQYGIADLPAHVPRHAGKMEENTDYPTVRWQPKEPGDKELQAEAIFAKRWQELEDERFAWSLQADLDRDHQLASPYGVPPSFASEFTVDSAPVSDDVLRLEFPVSGDNSLREYGQRVLSLCCAVCGDAFVRDGGDIVSRVKLMIGNQGLLRPSLSCNVCQTVSLVGCAHGKLPRIPCKDFSISWCCSEGYLFLLWALLCGPEYEKPVESALPRPSPSLPARTIMKSRLQRSKSSGPDRPFSRVSPKRLSRPSAVSSGTGYGGSDEFGFMPVGQVNGLVGGPALAFNPYRSPEPPVQDPRAEVAVWEKYFRAAAILLPSSARGLDSDVNTPPAVRLMLQRSPLLFKAAELLRNDSAVEIGAQEDLYNGLLDFIERLGSHKLTSHLVYDELLRHTADEQLISTCLASRQPAVSLFGDGNMLRNRVRGRPKAPEKTQSLASLVAFMSLQCGKIYRTATGLHNSFQAEEDQQLLVLCRRVFDLAEAHKASRVSGATASLSDPMDLDVERRPLPNGTKLAVSANTRAQTQAQAAYKAHEEMALWHRKNCVGEVPDERLLRDFYYSLQANTLLQYKSSVQPGRMKKLISELTMLSTALPEGIYVRHGESRLDAMKVLMVGPTGTPYEGGLFEFDLFCPENYPMVAPLVNFRTTGGGRIRFNPNLYEDGKVCLSLLGTWSGEPWRPNESTILQVLVSIQAMILNAEPWYNEPGRERMSNKSASESYNNTVQCYTLEHALLHWLNDRLALNKANGPNPSEPVGLFSEQATATAPPKSFPYIMETKLPTKTIHPSALYGPKPIVSQPSFSVAGAAPALWTGSKPLFPSPAFYPPPPGFVTPTMPWSCLKTNIPPLPYKSCSVDESTPIDLAAAAGVAVHGNEEFPVLNNDMWAGVDDENPYQEAILAAAAAGLQPKGGEPPSGDCIWADIVRRHFTVNGRAVLDLARKWKGGGVRRRPRCSRTQASLVEELEAALKRERFL